jgi:hypothetical protein
MGTITRDSLLPLEAYAKVRKSERSKVIEHRQLRTVRLGEHVSVQFEDEQTIRRQIQEMLHIEKIFDEEGIQGEIDAYAPLVPEGTNWKATMLIEYPDVHERRRELARLIGVADRLFVEVEGHPRIYAVADEDLDRETDEKTSARGARGSTCRGSGQAGMRPPPLSGACGAATRNAGQPGRRPEIAAGPAKGHSARCTA